MVKYKLEQFNKEVHANMDWDVFQKVWKDNKYKEATGKTAEQAYKFFGAQVPAK